MLSLTDTGFVEVTLTGGVMVSLYGVSYESFFVSANGLLVTSVRPKAS